MPVMMSRSRITKSAYFPAVSDPASFSMKDAKAGQMVIDLSASSRVIRCSGCQPPGGQPRSSCREIAEWNDRSGFTPSTGKSLPFGMITPVFSSDRHA